MVARLLSAVLFALCLSCAAQSQSIGPYPGGCNSNCNFTGTTTTAGINATGSVVVNGSRAPGPSDDSTVPFAVGNTWTDAFGHVFQAQDVTAGYAMWQQVQSVSLPGDVVGLNVSAASYTSGGGSCVANEVLTFTGGTQITVTACTSGVPSAATISQSRMHACMPATPTSISPLATTGGDGSSVWNLTIQSPVAMYGNRLLTRCYSGNDLNVSRSDTGETANIGFLSDGSLDTKTLDGFTAAPTPMAEYAIYTAGVNPRINTWYDQGGLGNNATQSTAADRPTLFPGRLLGNTRSVMMDGRANSHWDPTTPTFLVLPSGVAVAGNAFTAVMVAGVSSDNTGAYLLHIGAQSSSPLIYIDTGGGISAQCQNNGSNKILGPAFPDEATVITCVSSASATTFTVGNASSSGAAGTSTTLSTGTLGEAWNSAAQQPIDMSMVIIVPWALTAAEQQALSASVSETFSIATQKRGVLVAVGDSHIDTWGYPYQQNIMRQTAALLNRPDISFVNAAEAGADISSFVGTTVWTNTVAPTLAAYAGNKYVFMEGGYNDITAGQTVAQVEASFTAIGAAAHTAGARTICDTDVIRDATTTINGQIQQIAAWMFTATGVCDLVFNSQAYAIFDAPAGPWNLPWFEQADSALHMSAAGNGLRAGMLVNFIRTNSLFQ